MPDSPTLATDLVIVNHAIIAYYKSMCAAYTFSPSQVEIVKAMLGLVEYYDPPKSGMFPGYSGCAVKEDNAGQRHMHIFPVGVNSPLGERSQRRPEVL